MQHSHAKKTVAELSDQDSWPSHSWSGCLKNKSVNVGVIPYTTYISRSVTGVKQSVLLQLLYIRIMFNWYNIRSQF